ALALLQSKPVQRYPSCWGLFYSCSSLNDHVSTSSRFFIATHFHHPSRMLSVNQFPCTCYHPGTIIIAEKRAGQITLPLEPVARPYGSDPKPGVNTAGMAILRPGQGYLYFLNKRGI